MTDENNSSMKDCRDTGRKKDNSSAGMLGFGYFIAFIGAAVYFIQQATSFGTGLLGFLKACIWPYFLVYNLLEFLNL
ncbi:unnamed protein product [marine sediment metagenome]|uniref:Uncharacterized protein n=1 Tax=marine sediment metagenome TaxID=412755 RepID=X0ZJY9_9ZZZZ